MTSDLSVARAAPPPPIALVHDTSRRLRFRYQPGVDGEALHRQLQGIAGVRRVQDVPVIRSLTIEHDGRMVTRTAVLRAIERPAIRAHEDRRADASTRRARDTTNVIADSSTWAQVTAAAAIPALPAAARPIAALVLVGARALLERDRWTHAPATILLDSAALATTAMTGHPVTAGLSVALGALSERWSKQLTVEADSVLEALLPRENTLYAVVRAGARRELGAQALLRHDVVHLLTSWIVPADGIVRSGQAEIESPGTPAAGDRPTVRRGDQLFAGEQLRSGRVELLVQQVAARSRAARLREHVRHAMRTRDAPGALAPDLERLIALPITGASLVAALTGDAARAAAMLQADPQHGLALARPVAREAALGALLRGGVMLSGIDSIERLAQATTFAFQDIGVLTTPQWSVKQIELHRRQVRAAEVHAWLGRLAGTAGLPGQTIADHLLANWREHGAVVRDGERAVHVCGADLAHATWEIELPPIPHRGLVRRLAFIRDGELLAVVSFASTLRSNARRSLAALRNLGVRRIAILAEDLAPQPAAGLDRLGADTVLSTDRNEQAQWLAAAPERGERVALIHTGLRDLLPPGGLSLCPIDAEAGAHGVLIGNPLQALLAGRTLAQHVHRRLRRQTNAAVFANAALMASSALRLTQPVVTTSLHHAVSFLLLADSVRLARLSPPPAVSPSPSKHPD